MVIISESHKHGHVGFVLNKLTGHSVASIGQQRGICLNTTEQIYMGGPVNPNALTMLHTDEWYSSNTMVIGNGLAISSDGFMIEKLSMGNAPRKWRMISGMSGWAPGQLEREIDSVTGWLTVPASPQLALGFSGSQQWEAGVAATATTTINSYF